MKRKQIICITNRHLVKKNFWAQLEEIAATSVDAIILREKDLSPILYKAYAKNALELCKEWGLSSPVSALVTRPYITRHGNGPIPSQSPVIENFVDPNNKFNEFQKTIRAVQMDLSLLETSVFINTLNGGSNYPVLIVTHADELVDSTLNDNYDKLFSRLMVYHFEELV